MIYWTTGGVALSSKPNEYSKPVNTSTFSTYDKDGKVAWGLVLKPSKNFICSVLWSDKEISV